MNIMYKIHFGLINFKDTQHLEFSWFSQDLWNSVVAVSAYKDSWRTPPLPLQERHLFCLSKFDGIYSHMCKYLYCISRSCWSWTTCTMHYESQDYLIKMWALMIASNQQTSIFFIDLKLVQYHEHKSLLWNLIHPNLELKNPLNFF